MIFYLSKKVIKKKAIGNINYYNGKHCCLMYAKWKLCCQKKHY